LPNSGASAGTYGSQAVVPVITVNAKGQVTSATNTQINAVTLTTGSISTAPTNGTDIVNKNYADSIAAGINFHQACRLASTAALPTCTYNNGSSGVGATLTATANAALSVDGTLVAATNRILVKNQVNQAHNGVYVVTQTGSGAAPFILTRATDFDTPGSGVNQIDAGDFFLITAGTANANTSWVQQTPLPITVGTTAIVFSQFGTAGTLYTAGTGLTLAGTVFSITNTAVTAASYGSASAVPTYTVNAQGQLTAAADTSIAIAATQVTSGTLASARLTGSYTGITGVGTLTAGTWNATTIAVGYGGTGLTSYTIGDLVYASGATTLASLADVATGNALISGGVGAAPSYGKIGLTTHVSGTLPVANGGTNLTSYTIGDLVYASGTTTLASLADVATGNALISGGVGAAPSYGKIGLTTHVSGTLAATNGGTGFASYTIGDITYANTTTTLAKLADVATGNALISGGVGVAPSYGKIGLTTHVSGTLPVANGGTNLTSYTTGDLVYASGTTTLASLADVATGNALISGGVGAAPSYGKIGLTTHVSGILPVANGGTGASTLTANNVLLGNGTSAVQFVAPSTSGYMLVSNGTTWTSSNTITSTILSAPTINDGYTEETVTANTSTAYTVSLANGTFQILTLTGNCTFTFPTATAGQSFMMFLKQDATGSRTVTWPATVKWPSSTAPTITATASKGDKFVFTADGTNWLGSVAGQTYL
jgi:hypothetical protein